MLGLRILIKNTGCAGYAYNIEKVIKHNDNDLIFERCGAKLFVSSEILPLIDGTELDYVKEGLNYMFKFNNPKAKNICGCGESFSL